MCRPRRSHLGDACPDLGHHRVREGFGRCWARATERALRAYRELEALLTEVLGTAPSAATQDLYEGLLGITRPA